MRYPNALSGIRKIYTAEMLTLLAAVLGVAASVFGGIISQQIAGGGEITAQSAVSVLIPVLAAGLITIIAGIMQLFGLKDASADDESFRKGYTYALMGLVFSVAFTVLSNTKTGGSLLDDGAKLLSNIIEIAVTFFVIAGIKSLAEKLGDMNMVSRGKTVFNIYAASVICSSLAQLASAVLQNDLKTVVSGILGIITLVLTAVAYILYLGYLGRAKKMLA
ncbi:MAG: hypothetical protein K6G61_13025 [Solobacterium sp.]|nr:hypothetical protein [Solobacterium sp.]